MRTLIDPESSLSEDSLCIAQWKGVTFHVVMKCKLYQPGQHADMGLSSPVETVAVTLRHVLPPSEEGVAVTSQPVPVLGLALLQAGAGQAAAHILAAIEAGATAGCHEELEVTRSPYLTQQGQGRWGPQEERR